MKIIKIIILIGLMLITPTIFADSYIPLGWYQPSAVPGILWTMATINPVAKQHTPPVPIKLYPDTESTPLTGVTIRTKRTVITPAPRIIRINIASLHNYQIMRQSFNALETQGTINYRIIVGGTTNSIEVLGDPAVVPMLQYNVYNNVLKFSYQNKSAEVHHLPLLVVLHARQLNKINQGGSGSISVNYLTRQMLQVDKSGPGNLTINGKVQLVKLYARGSGNVYVNQIKTTNLYMNIKTSGIVKLTGVVTLAQLNFGGSGILNMYWIKSCNLTVRTTGSSTVSLAGIANVINAYAYGTSHLNLRFVRTQTMFVKSYQDASVDVWAHDNLFALARNNSNIYYYKEPFYKTRMMKESGTVLPMWNIPGAIVTFNNQGGIRAH